MNKLMFVAIKQMLEELEFPFTRMTHTENDTVILSWIVSGKYCEMEIHFNNAIYAWTAFETGEPKSWLVTDGFNETCFDSIRSSLIKMQEFME